jgi:uncharacterized protein (TIGR02444 family)
VTPPGFWEWSGAAYARAGSAEALLKLQDEFGLDVNILLWCCWCAQTKRPVSDLALREAIQATAEWSRDVTSVLRKARRALKTPPLAINAGALCNAVKDAELEAERLEQALLENLAGGVDAGRVDAHAPDDARFFLARYADLAGAVPKKGFSTLLLDDVVRAVFAGAALEAFP